MVRVGLRWACLGAMVLSVLANSAYVFGQAPEQRVRTNLATLEQWLTESKVADDWRPVLGLERLQQELAKGSAADRAALIDVLARFGADDPGLALERFVRVRQALVDWVASLPAPPAGQLSAEARVSKPVFLPLTAVDLADAKASLLAAVDRLDVALRSPKPGEPDWKAILQPERIRQELASKDRPELTALDAAYLRFASGQEGLARVWFADVREGLRQYLTLARAVGEPKLRKQYEILLEALAVRLDKYVKQPSADLAEEIDQALDWLDQAQQAKWVVKHVSGRLSHPNLFAEVSGGFIGSRTAEPVDDTQPVRDCILKTDIHGTGHTVVKLDVKLAPSPDRGQFDLVFKGETQLESVGYRGPFQIFSDSTTSVRATKRVTIDAEGISAAPTSSEAETSTTINCITSKRGLMENLASRRAESQRPQAESIAASHAEERFNEQIDRRADEMIAQANQRYHERFRRPLLERRLFPESLCFSTTPSALNIMAMAIAEGSLAAPGAPPQAGGSGDVSVRLHESAINNITGSALGGVVVDEKRFQQILTETLKVPRKAGEEVDEENWAITFSRRQPVTVTFGGDSFSVTIRGRAYASQGNQYPGMNVSATYKIQRAGQSFRAVRQGDLVVAPPGFRLGSGRQLSAREQVLRKVLERRFQKFFGPEFVPNNLVLAPEGREPLELQLSHWTTDNGWLVLAWKQVPPSTTPVAPKQSPTKTQSST